MKMLYHYTYSSLEGCEIEELIGLHCSIVSLGRKKLKRNMPTVEIKAEPYRDEEKKQLKK